MSIKNEISIRVSDLNYLNGAVLFLQQMLNEIQRGYALYGRLKDEDIPHESVANHLQWDTKQIAQIAAKIEECLNIAGDIYNSRDMADHYYEQYFSETMEQIAMLKQRASQPQP
jgi:hypothetical protein